MKKRCRASLKVFITAGAISLACLLVFPGQTSSAERVNRDYKPSSLVVIEGKTPRMILSTKQRFMVTSRTEIFDGRGKELTLRKLPVPCKAEVEYETWTYGQPSALEIVVREVYPGATTEWKTPAPE